MQLQAKRNGESYARGDDGDGAGFEYQYDGPPAHRKRHGGKDDIDFGLSGNRQATKRRIRSSSPHRHPLGYRQYMPPQKPAKQHEREKYAKQQQMRQNAILRARIHEARGSGYGYVVSRQVPKARNSGARVARERRPGAHHREQHQRKLPHAPRHGNDSPHREVYDEGGMGKVRGNGKSSGRGRGHGGESGRGGGGGGQGRSHEQQSENRHLYPGAPGEGGDEWSAIPVELNSMVIPSPAPDRPQHNHLDQEQRELLAEYEEHQSSTSGLYALDATNNGGGSIVSIGINDDGSVTVMPPKEDILQHGLPPGDDNTLSAEGSFPAAKSQLQGSSSGEEGSRSNGFPEGDQSSLLYYDIPAVNAGQNKDGVLGPADETFDAVLNSSNLRNDYDGIDQLGANHDGGNPGPGAADWFGVDQPHFHGDNAGLEYPGSLEHSSVQVTNWDDGEDSIGDGSGIPISSLWHDRAPMQPGQGPEGGGDGGYHEGSPAKGGRGEEEEVTWKEEEDGRLDLSLSTSGSIHLKHDVPSLEPRAPGDSNGDEDELADVKQQLLDHNCAIKRQPSNDDNVQLERSLEQFKQQQQQIE